jgi:hypothetical protein
VICKAGFSDTFSLFKNIRNLGSVFQLGKALFMKKLYKWRKQTLILPIRVG